MTTIKLHNKGERSFDLNGGRLGPDEVGEFDSEYGQKLLQMYPGELVDQAAATKKFQKEVEKFESPADFVAPADADQVLLNARAEAERIIREAKADAAKIKKDGKVKGVKEKETPATVPVNDDAAFEAEAQKNGMSVADYKEFKRLEAEEAAKKNQ